MPKIQIDYSKAVIYKISCLDESVTDCYIGLTTDFIRRKYSHKICCGKKDLLLYNFINENGGWDNFKMEIIHECDNTLGKQECMDLETKFINDYNATLNVNKFDRKTYAQKWYQTKRDEYKNRKRQDKYIVNAYWNFQYDINNNPEWYINNINKRRL